jgi:hypothetical protein
LPNPEQDVWSKTTFELLHSLLQDTSVKTAVPHCSMYVHSWIP